MNFEELHNELNDFPDALKYDDQHWERALALIEANEAFVKRKKAVFFSSMGALIVAAFFFGNSLDEVAEYQPRTEQAVAFHFSEEVDEVAKKELVDISEVNSYVEVSEKLAVSNEVQSESDEIGISENPIIATPNERSSRNILEEIISDATSDQVQGLSETDEHELLEENQSPSVQEYLNLEELANNSNNTGKSKLMLEPEERTPANGLHSGVELDKAEVSYAPLSLKTNYLTRSFKKSGLRNTNKVLLGNSFVRYFKFLEVKVGVNPWADFGRSDLLGNYNPLLGLAYEAPISKKLSWNVGAEYMNISGMNLSVSSENTSYRFGKESEITTVYTDKAHFANVPLGLALNVLPRVQLKTGVNASILMQTANTLEQRVQTHQSDEVLSEEKTEGYKSSFSTMQLSASLGARYWLSGRNALQINFHKGLTDFSKNDAFLSDRVDLTSRIEISINRVIR